MPAIKDSVGQHPRSHEGCMPFPTSGVCQISAALLLLHPPPRRRPRLSASLHHTSKAQGLFISHTCVLCLLASTSAKHLCAATSAHLRPLLASTPKPLASFACIDIDLHRLISHTCVLSLHRLVQDCAPRFRAGGYTDAGDAALTACPPPLLVSSTHYTCPRRLPGALTHKCSTPTTYV